VASRFQEQRTNAQCFEEWTEGQRRHWSRATNRLNVGTDVPRLTSGTIRSPMRTITPKYTAREQLGIMYVKLYRAQLHGQLPSLSYEYLKTDAVLRQWTWIMQRVKL